MTVFQPKDFVATSENLLFAVVSRQVEDNKVPAFLRYVLDDHGVWRKLDSDAANAYLSAYFPGYLHYSRLLDAQLHAVPILNIQFHYQPRQQLQRLLSMEAKDAVLTDLKHLCALLFERGLSPQSLGVTGSLLVGMQNHASDIDLVIYDRDQFQRARLIVQDLIAHDRCQTLSDADWLSAYHRRGCDFPLDDYIWHEQRKYNKAMINNRKFDLSLLAPSVEAETSLCHKLGPISIETLIVADEYAFDYPARYLIDHPGIAEIVSFTATYCGQAQSGERVRVSGQLEQDSKGSRRIVVGSNREAIGELIRVIR